MVFVAQNDLEAALMAAATDPAAQPLFYDLFLGSEIYAILAGPPPEVDEAGGPVEDQPVRLATIEHEGHSYVCVFTSVARIQEAGDHETPYLGVNGRKLLEGMPEAAVIVNPSSDYGKFMPAPEIRAMLDGELFRRPEERRIAAGASVSVATPEHPLADSVVSGIVSFLAGERHVREAHLLQAQFEGDSEPGHVLVMVLDDVEQALGVMQRFSPRLGALLPPGVFLDTWPVEKLPSGVLEVGARIYAREKPPWWKRRRA